jgi:hypothetical protein
MDVLRSCLGYLKRQSFNPEKKEMNKNFISSFIRNFRAFVPVNFAAAEKKRCLHT